MRFVRQYQFDPEIYTDFEQAAEQRGASVGGIFRKVMRDYTSGTYVTVDDLTTETLCELRRFAKESFGSQRSLQVAVTAIINKWAAR